LALVILIACLAVASSTAQEKKVSEESLLIPETGAEPAARAPEAPLVSTWDFIRMLLILALVIGAIYLVFFLLRKGLKKKLPENELIRLLGSRSLSANRALHLVGVGKCLFLIGASDGGVALIAEIKDQETVDTLRLETPPPPERAGKRFGEILLAMLKPGKKAKLDIDQSVDFIRQQRERLKRLGE